MNARHLVLGLVLALGCANVGAPAHGPLKATGLVSAFEGKTWYQCTQRHQRTAVHAFGFQSGVVTVVTKN